MRPRIAKLQQRTAKLFQGVPIQFTLNERLDALDGIQGMYVNLSGQEFDGEAAFNKVNQAEHSNRIDDAAGNQSHGVIDGFGRRVGQIAGGEKRPDF
jgi:hypothetical protein